MNKVLYKVSNAEFNIFPHAFFCHFLQRLSRKRQKHGLCSVRSVAEKIAKLIRIDDHNLATKQFGQNSTLLSDKHFIFHAFSRSGKLVLRFSYFSSVRALGQLVKNLLEFQAMGILNVWGE